VSHGPLNPDFAMRSSSSLISHPARKGKIVKFTIISTKGSVAGSESIRIHERYPQNGVQFHHESIV
jgi:hypothetical protein